VRVDVAPASLPASPGASHFLGPEFAPLIPAGHKRGRLRPPRPRKGNPRSRSPATKKDGDGNTARQFRRTRVWGVDEKPTHKFWPDRRGKRLAKNRHPRGGGGGQFIPHGRQRPRGVPPGTGGIGGEKTKSASGDWPPKAGGDVRGVTGLRRRTVKTLPPGRGDVPFRRADFRETDWGGRAGAARPPQAFHRPRPTGHQYLAGRVNPVSPGRGRVAGGKLSIHNTAPRPFRGTPHPPRGLDPSDFVFFRAHDSHPAPGLSAARSVSGETVSERHMGQRVWGPEASGTSTEPRSDGVSVRSGRSASIVGTVVGTPGFRGRPHRGGPFRTAFRGSPPRAPGRPVTITCGGRGAMRPAGGWRGPNSSDTYRGGTFRKNGLRRGGWETWMWARVRFVIQDGEGGGG